MEASLEGHKRWSCNKEHSRGHPGRSQHLPGFVSDLWSPVSLRKMALQVVTPVPSLPLNWDLTCDCFDSETRTLGEAQVTWRCPGRWGQRERGHDLWVKKCSLNPSSSDFWRTPPSCNWDRLGPGTLCRSACTWTNISSSNEIQRNYKGLKITVCMQSWGKLWTIRYKKTEKTQLPLLKSRKAAYLEQKQKHIPPAFSTTQGVVKTPKPPLWPDPWTHPYLLPI